MHLMTSFAHSGGLSGTVRVVQLKIAYKISNPSNHMILKIRSLWNDLLRQGKFPIVYTCTTYFQQDTIPVGSVPPTCEPYVFWWPPLDISTVCGGIPTPPPRPRYTYPPRRRHLVPEIPTHPPTPPPVNTLTDTCENITCNYCCGQ